MRMQMPLLSAAPRTRSFGPGLNFPRLAAPAAPAAPPPGGGPDDGGPDADPSLAAPRIPAPRAGAPAAAAAAPMLAPAAPATTMAAPAASMFQRSLDTQRALEANKAATFAAGAPAPAASTFGDPGTAAAARNAFVTTQRAKANLASGNYFADEGRRQDANARANAQSAAGVSLMGAQGGLLTAQGNDLAARGRLLYPGMARNLDAQAADATSQTRERDALLAPRVRQAGAAASGAEAEALAAPGVLGNQVEAGAIDNQLHRSLIAPTVRGAEASAGITPEVFHMYHQALGDMRQVARMKVDATLGAGGQGQAQPGATPDEDFALRQKQYDYFTKIGRPDLAAGIFPTRGMTPVPQQDTGGEKAPGAPTAAKGAEQYPEGTQSETKDGRPVVWRGGKWVADPTRKARTR